MKEAKVKKEKKKKKKGARVCKETYLLQATNPGERAIGCAEREDCLLGLVTSHSHNVLIFVLSLKETVEKWVEEQFYKFFFFFPMISFSVLPFFSTPFLFILFLDSYIDKRGHIQFRQYFLWLEIFVMKL